MLSLKKCKRINPELKKFSENKVIRVRKELYEMAQLALENWFKEKDVSKNHEWLLLDKEESVK